MHVIRPQKNASIPSGKPDVMFFVPEIFGGHNFGKRIDQKDVKVCKELYGAPKKICSEEFNELVRLVLPHHDTPANA